MKLLEAAGVICVAIQTLHAPPNTCVPHTAEPCLLSQTLSCAGWMALYVSLCLSAFFHVHLYLLSLCCLFLQQPLSFFGLMCVCLFASASLSVGLSLVMSVSVTTSQPVP